MVHKPFVVYSSVVTNTAFLERLTQNLQNVARELRQFIEKEHAIVGHADFTWPRDRTATNQPRI